jgi:hypothetical protein
VVKSFYLGMPINNGTPGSRDGRGIEQARKVRDALEAATGDRCISRWIDHPFQNQDPFLRTMAVTDIVDLGMADYAILLPLTVTCRGTHFEMGAAVMAGKPTYLYVASKRDPMAFDQLCLPFPVKWAVAIERVLGINLCSCGASPPGFVSEDKEHCGFCGGTMPHDGNSK